MFLAKVACLIVYYFATLLPSSKPVTNPEPTLRQKLIFFIPGLCDFMSTSLCFIGLTMTAASAYQMMIAGGLIWTFLFSIVFLKSRYNSWHYAAVVLVVLGLALVGVSSVLWSKVHYKSNYCIG
eukprot:TRINITY_DN73330_c0_g1_i1.p5 TRINITY_DN73330_c0_g1~~TRINITY_DN73330_c0_g1_i1.p5  ORF type:complete len:124 (-),score=3.22 TRINITY_DN73330_c0_g1_i1:787-1158(-)